MMEKVRLGDICNILNGYAFKSSEYKESGIRVIRITNVQSGYIEDKEPKYYSFEKKAEIGKYMLKENDILISLTGNVGRVGLLKKEMLPAALNQRVACIRIKENKNISINYIFNILNTKKFLKQCEINSKGIAQKNLSTEWLKNYLIDIPNFEEQAKISNNLDKVKNMIDLRKKQIKELDELIKSQFVEMFGNIENTKYKVYKLSELTNLITDGEHKKPNYIEKGIPFISVVNITTGELIFDGCKFVSEEDAYKFNKRCNPEKDDILYTKIGATYGRSVIVNTNNKFTLYVSVCLIKPKKELINPIFLNYTMRQPYVKLQADKCIKGIGVPDLHLIEIKNFNIIVPPIEKQNEFAKFVKQIDKQKFMIEKSLKETEELQESLMNKYFGGYKNG